MRVQKQILRITGRRQHTAKVSSQRLQDNNPLHIHLQGFADNQRQRHKGQQGHIIRHEHQADIGNCQQHQLQLTLAAAFVQQLHRQPVQKAYLLQLRYHQHQRKQYRQHVKIYIGKLRPAVKAADSSQNNRYAQNRLTPPIILYFLHQQKVTPS